MKADPVSNPLPAPPGVPVALPVGRTPGEPSLRGLIADAGVFWRAGSQALTAPNGGGSPVDEYRALCEFLRLYATLRFYQLALLLGTTGSLITALSSLAVRASFARAEFLKTGALVVCVAFTVIEFGSTSYSHRLRDRANELAGTLGYQPLPCTSRWNPLTPGGAGLYLHLFIAAMWLASLFVRLA